MLRFITSLSFICVLMAVSCMAQDTPVLDTDGNPVRRGVEYYVDPAITDVAGGLTLVGRNGSCPSYVGQVPIRSGTSLQSIPVTFTPRNPGDTIITENTEFTVAFSANSRCVANMVWGIGEEDSETRSRLIVVGRQPAFFDISRNQAPAGPYTFGWCPECDRTPCGRPRCGVAGILEQNGTRFLTIDGNPPFPFSFRRA